MFQIQAGKTHQNKPVPYWQKGILSCARGRISGPGGTGVKFAALQSWLARRPHQVASGSCGTRDKLKPPAARPGNPTCSSGQRYLPKRGRFILVGFIWGNVASSLNPPSSRSMRIGGDSGSMRQILNLPSTPGFCDNKSAGRALEHMRYGRPIKILPHTSEIQTNIAQKNRPFNAK